MIKHAILIGYFMLSCFFSYGQQTRFQRPGQLSEDLGFAVYIVGEEEGYFSLKINDVIIFNNVHFVPEHIPEDPTVEYICSEGPMISTVYYYVPSIDGYILEAELGRNEHNDILGIQKLYHKPPFGDNLHSQKLRISFTMNGKDYLFKAKVNRKKGKALHISVSTQPPELIQSWVYGVFKTKY